MSATAIAISTAPTWVPWLLGAGTTATVVANRKKIKKWLRERLGSTEESTSSLLPPPPSGMMWKRTVRTPVDARIRGDIPYYTGRSHLEGWHLERITKEPPYKLRPLSANASRPASSDDTPTGELAPWSPGKIATSYSGVFQMLGNKQLPAVSNTLPNTTVSSTTGSDIKNKRILKRDLVGNSGILPRTLETEMFAVNPVRIDDLTPTWKMKAMLEKPAYLATDAPPGKLDVKTPELTQQDLVPPPNPENPKNPKNRWKRIRERLNKPGKLRVQKNGMLGNGPSIMHTTGKVLSTSAGLGAFHEGVEALYDLEFMRPYREAAKYEDYVNYADALAAEEENRQIEAEYSLLYKKLEEQTEIENKLDSISKQNDLNNKQLLRAREYGQDSLPMLKERLKLYIEQEPLRSKLGPNLRPRIDSLVKRYNDNLMRSYNGRQLKYWASAKEFTPFWGEYRQAVRGDSKPIDKFISWFGDSWNLLDMTGKLSRGVKPWKVFAAEGIANSMGPALLKMSGELEHKLNSYSPIQLPEGTISIPTSLGTQTVANSGIERGLDVISKAF